MNALQQHFQRVRQRTAELVAPLSAEDCCAQSMPDTSPAKWHLAHTTWFFETFVLEPRETDFQAFNAAYRVLFNSYYNGVGDKHPRPQRGLLTRPGLTDVLAYRLNVEQRMQRLLGAVDDSGDDSDARNSRDKADVCALRALVTLGLHHEQQHQELLLTDGLHLLSCNPIAPAYLSLQKPPVANLARGMQWVDFPGGLLDIGHAGEGFAFDNELPRHRAYTAPYALANRLVTSGEYAAFVAGGGYQKPELWLAEGWDWLAAQSITQPLYWRVLAQGKWMQFGLDGEQPLQLDSPVSHLSYFEADAYARWAGARLPTEVEWEAAAASSSYETVSDAAVLSSERLHESNAPASHGLRELFGEVWQWTQSSYAAYPGFKAAPGAVGEYNGKFMVNQYVLRGSSCATAPGHARLTYRNFFPATARWQFTGLRLARDASN